jgi:hypothetical protein
MLGGREEEPAIGFIRMLRIEILAAFDKYPSLLKHGVARRRPGGPQRLQNIARHREIHVARIGRGSTIPTHTPGAISRILFAPSIVSGELLTAKILDHASDLCFPTRSPGQA